MTNYDESQVTAFQADVRATYLEAGQPLNAFDDASVVWSNRTTWDAQQMGWEASRAKHLRELRQALGLIAPLPPIPTRDQVLSATVGFQGLTTVTAQYGNYPMFGPETTTLSDSDLDLHCQTLIAEGFQGGEIAVSWQYAEPGFLMPVPGRDLTNNLAELTRRVGLMLRSGLTTVVVFLAGDGRSAPPNPDGSYPYNDSIGHTYGHEWLMATLPRIIDAFRNSADGDLTKYVIFCPGYDGVFYGWGNLPSEPATPDLQPQRVIDFGNLFRSICPNGYLAIEHSTGKVPVGNATADWTTGGPLDAYDLLLSEFDDPITPNPPGDQVWQVVARCSQPYTRPANQPSGDDPNPPFYLGPPTTRGARYYWAYEFATYPWTRGHRTVAQINEDRAYFTAMGVEHVC